MSVWYQHDVTILGKREALAKFLNLDPKSDIRTDRVELSFGGNHIPGIRLGKIVEQNPDLIFLVKESVECDTVSWWVERYNVETAKEEFILIQDFGMVENKLNKRILEEYDRSYPSLVLKHLNAQEGYVGFRWTMFLNDFDKLADMLKQADSYQEMVDPYKHFDIKRYVIEWEMANDSEPRHVYHEGPFSLGTAQRMIERSAKDTGMVNVNLKEVRHNNKVKI